MESGPSARLVCAALVLMAFGAVAEPLCSAVRAQDVGVSPPATRRTPPVRRRHHIRAPRPQLTARYRRMRAHWHQAAPTRERDRWSAMLPRPPLVLVLVAEGARLEMTPERDDGGFDAECLRRAEALLAARRSGARHPIDPGVLDRVYRAQRHFRVPFVWVVSGFREDRATSRHTMGRAMDVVMPGVRDTVVAEYLRGEGFSGVGTYLLSGFVHIDVRNRSYFWLDRTAPGQRSRARRVLVSRASSADARARARGVEPPLPPSAADDAADDDEASIETPDVIALTGAVSPAASAGPSLAAAPPSAPMPAPADVSRGSRAPRGRALVSPW